jgi:hypothetical protein
MSRQFNRPFSHLLIYIKTHNIEKIIIKVLI